MAKELLCISKQVQILNNSKHNTTITDEGDQINNIIQLVKTFTGVDFGHYKKNSLRRRITRRMLLFKLTSFVEYLQYLEQDTNEINLLYRDLLINVTAFFRYPEPLNILQNNLLPLMLQRLSVDNPLRIWVPACSTGEEAYSIAMVIAESLDENVKLIPLRVFATDLSKSAINKARTGVFTADEVANISPQRLNRFFVKTGNDYRVVKSLRKLCVFSVHKIFNDPPFSRLHIISCSNLLIYLDSVLHKKILSIFHNALNNDGYLILGKSETVGSASNLFASLNNKVKLYIRKNTGSTKVNDTSSFPIIGKANTRRSKLIKSQPSQLNRTSDLDKVADTILVTHYIPPAVIINYDLEILRLRGEANRFLEPIPGRTGKNILTLVHKGMVAALSTAISQCIKTNQTVKVDDVAVQLEDKIQYIVIEVRKLVFAGKEDLLLIIFIENKWKDPEMVPVDKSIMDLQNQLVALRTDMSLLLDVQETANENLQTANEEIVSSNEELQSINEELETSKEEIESSNEELLAINAELLESNEQLAESKKYTEIVIATIREAVVILDKDLRIKSANRAFFRIFKLTKRTTEGKNIYRLDNKQWDIPKLRDLLTQLLLSSEQLQGVEIAHTFSKLGEKILIVDARKIIQQFNQEQTILLSIEDITEHRKNEKLIADREAWFRNMNDNVPIMIWVAGINGEFSFVNKTWLQFTGRTMQQEMMDGWRNEIHPDDIGHYLRIYKESFNLRKSFRIEYRMRRFDGEFRWQLGSAVPTFSSSLEFTGFTGSCIEIHTEKLINEELEKRVGERTRELREVNNSLKNSNNELEQFAYVASHDLQEPLRKILTFSDQLEEQYAEQLSDEGREFLAKIITSSERMTQLIDDLLDFSRITQTQTGFVETDLNEVLTELLVDFEVIIAKKKARIILNHDLPLLWANRLQMRQLFHNLLSNSLKFTEEDKIPIISFSFRPLPAEEVDGTYHHILNKSKVYYEIAVEDNGIGFSQEYAEQAFTIFQRLHDRLQYPGTGIGLALCRKIIENHQGIITVKSGENMGTTFLVILPAQLDNALETVIASA